VAGQRFADAELALGVEPRTGGLAAHWFDLDAAAWPRRFSRKHCCSRSILAASGGRSVGRHVQPTSLEKTGTVNREP
jgi:hypothetical protein